MPKKGYKQTNEHKIKRGKIHKGFKHSDKAKRAISLSKVGKHRSEKTKEKIRVSRIGKSSGMLGKNLSIESKKKLSVALTGKIKSKKTRKKMSDSKMGEKNPMFGKRQSEETRKKRSGNKHYRWNHGATSEKQKIRDTEEYRIWRLEVFFRDNFTCKKYNTKDKTIQAHHIENFSEYPELRFKISNGITLSKKAHIEFHKKYGYKNNTLEQLIKFLNK